LSDLDRRIVVALQEALLCTGGEGPIGAPDGRTVPAWASAPRERPVYREMAVVAAGGVTRMTT
jgi:hypothetical protein